MSTTIDERVVSMQFDNKHFESNVQTSMSTLDKLKQKLNLTGASKGLENVNNAASKIKFAPLTNAVQTVQLKFSALEVAGVTALANIANSAVNAGKKMIKALTIDPITTGFNEYEMKMDSIRTILASTGEDLSTVNKYLEELNEYSDQTIYSFSDMTQNIGKFTNAGVKLEDAVLAIKGISNEAAVSGANANEASRAMYNFAQALSAGYVKLIDWKSIENANMATVEFKNQLIQAAVAAGTLTDAGNGMYKTLDGTVISATQNFNDSLQDQWMTTEVLVSTLKDYADAETDIGKKAFEAATKVTKFTQMFDVLKETAQSGWAKTWEIIVGDFEQARAILTPLTTFFSNLIDGISDFRNNLLEGALGSPFGQMISRLSEKLDGAAKVTEKLTKVSKDYEDVVNRIIDGEFGNGQARWDKLTEAGYDWAHAQNLVNEKLGVSLRRATSYTEAQDEAGEATSRTTEQILAMSDAQLENLGFTQEEIELLRALEEQSKATGIPVQELMETLNMPTGRELLIESFKNAGSGLVAVCKAIKDAWVEIFPPPTSDQLYNVINGLHTFSTHLVVSDDTAGKLKRTLKGVLAIFDMIFTVVGGAGRIVFKLLTRILGMFNLDILDVTAAIGDLLVMIDEWIFNNELVNFVIEQTVIGLVEAVKAIRKWITALIDMPKVQEILGGFKDGIADAFGIGKNLILGLINGIKDGSIIDAILGLGRKIIDTLKDILGIHSPSTVMFEIGKNVIQGLCNGIEFVVTELLSTVGNIANKIVEVFKNINVDWDKVLSVAAGAAIIGTAYKIADALHNLTEPFAAISDILEAVPQVVENAAKVVKSFSKVLNAFAFSVRAKALKDIATAILMLVGSVIVLTFIDPAKLWGAVKVLAAVAAIMAGLILVVGLMGKMVKTTTTDEKGAVQSTIQVGKLALAIIGIGASLLMVAGALKTVSKIEPTRLIGAVVALGVILGGMVGIVAAYGKLVSLDASRNMSQVGTLMIKLGIATMLMAFTLKMIAKLDPGDVTKGLITIGAFSGIIIGITAATKLLGPWASTGPQLFKKLASTMLMMVVVTKLISWLEPSEIVKGVMVMSLFGGIIVGLTAATKLAGDKQVDKLGRTLLAMSASMLIMTAVVKIVSGMSLGDITKGVVAMTLFGFVIAGLIDIIDGAGGPQEGARIAGTLLAMSAAIAILAGVSVVLGFVDVANLAKGVVAVSILGSIVSLMVYATRGASKCVGNIIAMSVAIAIMAGSMALLTLVDPVKLQNAALALGALMLAFSAMIGAAGAADGVTVKTIVAIGIMAATVAGFAFILKMLKDIPVASSLANATSLSIMILALAGAINILGEAKSVSVETLAKTGLLGLIMTALSGALVILQDVDPEASIANAIALGVMINALSAAMVILGNAKDVSSKALVGAGVLGIIMNLLAAAMLIVQDVDPEASIPNAIALSVMINALSAACIVLSKVKTISTSALIAAGTMSLIMLALAKSLDIVGDMKPDVVLSNAKGISTLLLALSGALVILSAVGLFATEALAGVQVLVLFIAELGILMTAIGALVTWIPDLETFLDKGIVILQKIGEGLGKFIGSIIGGVADAISKYLPDVGANLTKFMENADGFIQGVKKIDSKTLSNVTQLVAAMIELTAASFIDGIRRFMPFSSDFGDMGEELSDFMEDASGFIDGVKKMNKTSVEGAKVIVDLVETLGTTSFLDAMGRIFSFGKSPIEEMCDNLSSLGEGVAEFVDEVGQLSDGDVDRAKALGSLLEVLADSLGDDGQFLGFIGDTNLEDFADGLSELATGLKKFLRSIDDLEGILRWNSKTNGYELSTKIIATFDFIKLLTDVNKELSSYDEGKAGGFFGDTNLEDFANGLDNLARGLVKFHESVSGLDDITAYYTLSGTWELSPKLKGIFTLIDELIGVSKSVASFDEGKAGGWFGDTNLEDFADGLFDLAWSIAGFLEAVESLDNVTAYYTLSGTWDLSPKIKGVFTLINELVNVAKTISSFEDGKAGGWFGDTDLEDFANGLYDLAQGIELFLTTVNAFDVIDTTKASLAVDKVKELVEVAREVSSFDEGKAGGWFGDTNFEDFADGVGDLGEGLESFYGAIEGVNIDENKINQTINAATSLVEMSNSLKSSNGKSWWESETNFEDFADGVREFGRGIAEFYYSLEDVAYLDSDKLENVIAAGSAMADLASKLDFDDGQFLGFIGDTNLEDFVEGMSEYGKAIADFCEELEDISLDPAMIKVVADAGLSIAEMAEDIGDVDMVFVADGFANLEQNMSSLGSGMSAFAESTADMATGHVASVIDACNRIAAMSAGLPDNTGLFDGNWRGEVFKRNALTFANGIKDFLTNTEAISEIPTSAILDSCREFAMMAYKIPTEGGLFGENEGLAEFPRNVDSFMEGIKVLSDAGSKLNGDNISAALGAGHEVAKMVNDLTLSTNGSDISQLGTELESFGGSLSRFSSTIENVNSTGITELAQSLANAKTTITSSIDGLFDGAIDSANKAVEKFTIVGKEIVSKLVSGITDNKADVPTEMKSVVSEAAASVATPAHYIQFYNAGGYLVDGFANGISASGYLASAKACAVATMAKQAIEEALGIASPSKVMATIGAWFTEGFAKGISNSSETKNATNSATDLANAVIETMRDILGIHSPSTEAFEIGEWWTEGLAEGLTSQSQIEYLRDHAKTVADELNRIFELSGMDSRHYTANYLEGILDTDADKLYDKYAAEIRNKYNDKMEKLRQDLVADGWTNADIERHLSKTEDGTVWTGYTDEKGYHEGWNESMDRELENAKALAEYESEQNKKALEDIENKVEAAEDYLEALNKIQKNPNKLQNLDMSDQQKAKLSYQAMTGTLGEDLYKFSSALEEYSTKASTATAETNELAESSTAAASELDDMAQAVLRGDWGNGQERIDRLTEAGYNYAAIQNRVNELLGISKVHVDEYNGALMISAENLTEAGDAAEEAATKVNTAVDELNSTEPVEVEITYTSPEQANKAGKIWNYETGKVMGDAVGSAYAKQVETWMDKVTPEQANKAGHIFTSAFGQYDQYTDDVIQKTVETAVYMSDLVANTECEITCTPVVDHAATATIHADVNEALNSPYTMDVVANLSTSMANPIINPILGKLETLFGNMEKTLAEKGDTYVINGVTYDDGSNIATFAGGLVRALRMEGRS